MENIYESVISDLATTQKGREDLFLLCSCVAEQAKEATTAQEKSEKKRLARYLLFSVCAAHKRQSRFYRSLMRILRPVARPDKEVQNAN